VEVTVTFFRIARACPALVVAVLLASPGPAAAQNSVTSADIQRLQDNVFDATRDIAEVRGRDSALAVRLQAELDDARDETIYLKVKLRKNEPIARSEYADLRDRIEDIRSRARGDAAGRYSAAPAAPAVTDAPRSPTPSSSRRSGEVPVGTELDVRLQNRLTSNDAQVEDRFEATTMVDLTEGDRVVVPAGSLLRGVVSSVTPAGRLERKGSLTLAFDQITVGGRTYPLRATVTQALESEGVRGEAARIGTGAGVGAIIGGILGGFKGALAGILIGGGGTIAATEGKDVELPAGTVLRVRLDQPLAVR
jgi:hypothetical protein